MTPGATASRVHILLALYNGAAHLDAQLQSLADQTHRAWDLTVGDDGSTDAGPGIVRRFADRMAPLGNRVTLTEGPRRGDPTANFLTLIAGLPEDGCWAALCDQDDVWLPERLARGLVALDPLPRDRPALYCSATWITGDRLENRRLSMRTQRPPGFRNALVQNIAAGNTILLNPAAVALARRTAHQAAAVPGLAAHDWWLYLLISGAGGSVIRDPAPTLLYRQHGRNQVGANDSWKARMLRIGLLLSGRFSAWNAGNIAALRSASAYLTDDNRALLERFAALRAAPLPRRCRQFAALQLYRQSRMGQAALWMALLLRRI